MKCKECGKEIEKGKRLIALAWQSLKYCKDCYLVRFERKDWNLPPLRQGNEPLLSQGEYQRRMKRQFEGCEEIYWTPEFYAEWIESMSTDENPDESNEPVSGKEVCYEIRL